MTYNREILRLDRDNTALRSYLRVKKAMNLSLWLTAIALTTGILTGSGIIQAMGVGLMASSAIGHIWFKLGCVK